MCVKDCQSLRSIQDFSPAFRSPATEECSTGTLVTPLTKARHLFSLLQTTKISLRYCTLYPNGVVVPAQKRKHVSKRDFCASQQILVANDVYWKRGDRSRSSRGRSMTQDIALPSLALVRQSSNFDHSSSRWRGRDQLPNGRQLNRRHPADFSRIETSIQSLCV
jgi:hypothetical protein